MAHPDQAVPAGKSRGPCAATGTAGASLAAASTGQPGARRRIDSEQLFGGGDEIEINHAGAQYRLRITALGKLILTK